MRKTLNINLGGMAFIIDENAFEMLHNYLEALKAKFHSESERDEILNDIEARIAEMLNHKLGDRKEVVSVEDVQSIIAVMGKPEDIAGEETAETTTSSTAAPSATATSSSSSTAYPGVKKRLYRDPDDAKVGGVIAGLCHYFGINDPAWARIAALVLIPLTYGSVILLYFLLVIVIPKAMTSAEKLQMKGEPINIGTIEKEIKDAASRAGESVNKFVKEDNFFEKLFHILASISVVFAKIIAGFVIFIALIVMFALLAGVFGVTMAGNILFSVAPNLLVDSHSTIVAFNIGIILIVGSMVVAVIYAALRLIFGQKGRAPWLKWSLLGLWWVGIFLLIYTGITIGNNFKISNTKREDIALMQPANGNVFVQLIDSSGSKLPKEDDDDNGFNINFDGVFIHGDDLKDVQMINIGRPSLQLMPSPNDSFYVEKIVSSQGKSKGDAERNAGYVTYNISQTDTVVNLPGHIYLDKNSKWRAQDVKIRIEIPEGKHVSFADNIDRWVATVKGDGNYDDTEFANTTWTLENGKVKCIGGENHSHSSDDKEEKEMTKHEKKMKQAEKKLDEAHKKLEEKMEKLDKKTGKQDKQKEGEEKSKDKEDF